MFSALVVDDYGTKTVVCEVSEMTLTGHVFCSMLVSFSDVVSLPLPALSHC